MPRTAALSRSSRWSRPVAALAAAALLSTACASNPVTGRREVSLLSEAEEIAIGQRGEDGQGHLGVVGPFAWLPTEATAPLHQHRGVGAQGRSELVAGTEGVAAGRGQHHTGCSVGADGNGDGLVGRGHVGG